MCARCQAYIVHKTRWHYDGSIKDAKITLKQYLIDVIFLFYIFCVLGFCDIYLQKMWIRPYDMLYTIENHDLKIRNISRSSIYIVLYDSAKRISCMRNNFRVLL